MKAATTKVIVNAAARINSQEDLSVSFIQIGDDRSATKFLKFLDDNLRPQGAKFDIHYSLSHFFKIILFCLFLRILFTWLRHQY